MIEVTIEHYGPAAESFVVTFLSDIYENRVYNRAIVSGNANQNWHKFPSMSTRSPNLIPKSCIVPCSKIYVISIYFVGMSVVHAFCVFTWECGPFENRKYTIQFLLKAFTRTSTLFVLIKHQKIVFNASTHRFSALKVNKSTEKAIYFL